MSLSGLRQGRRHGRGVLGQMEDGVEVGFDRAVRLVLGPQMSVEGPGEVSYARRSRVILRSG
jgi:hypothetical protein